MPPTTGRRSEALQKKLQIRNKSLKPADFTKDQSLVNHVETKKDPIEKSKAALSDLRKRIDERKRMSKMIDIQQYQEGREEPVPELTGVTFSESPISQERQEIPSRSMKNHYKDQDRYRKDAPEEEAFDKAPPAHIEVRSEVPDYQEDDDTEVSEITTDVRIMSTKGASFVERRMAGNVQMRLARPSLSTPTAGQHLERDVNINVSNLRNLGKAVEEAKMDLRKEMSPVNADPTRRHGLPYESTDYRPSVDEEDSWGDAIRTDNQEKEEQKGQFIADKNAAKKLQKLVKEAYSYEGDVFIDATDIREEDLDGEEPVSSDGGNHTTTVKVDDTTLGTSELLGAEILPSEVEGENGEEKMELPQQSEDDSPEVKEENDSNQNHEEIKSDDQTPEGSEKKPSSFANNPAAMASEFYNSSVGFFKSFSNQVDAQVKTFQEKGLISKSAMDSMLGVLNKDVKETEAKLPKDTDDAVIFLGDEFEASVCGTDLTDVDENISKNIGSNPDPVEKMLETLKISYKTGISKCGIDSDMLKENTKAIEEMVANLKKANSDKKDAPEGEASEDQAECLAQEKIDGDFLELSSQ